MSRRLPYNIFLCTTEVKPHKIKFPWFSISPYRPPWAYLGTPPYYFDPYWSNRDFTWSQTNHIHRVSTVRSDPLLTFKCSFFHPNQTAFSKCQASNSTHFYHISSPIQIVKRNNLISAQKNQPEILTWRELQTPTHTVLQLANLHIAEDCESALTASKV